jgi:plastocyanin
MKPFEGIILTITILFILFLAIFIVKPYTPASIPAKIEAVTIVVPTVIPTVSPTLGPMPTQPPESKTVLVYVDAVNGFYKIRGAVNDTPRHLILNTGDKVTWINDDMNDEMVYIINKENLWGGHIGYSGERLPVPYQRFSYTFNNTGNYTVTSQNKPRLNQIMTVVVK